LPSVSSAACKATARSRFRRVAGIEDAGAGDLTFFTNPKYAPELRRTRASAIILSEQAEAAPCAMLRVQHPYLALAKAIALFASPDRPPVGVHRLADVAMSAAVAADARLARSQSSAMQARIGARSIIYPHAVIGAGAQIGSDCVIHARVSIRERVSIGDRVVVQDGAVIGSDGFGFATGPDGGHQKIPQVGGVAIEDDVEVGANATIDRPAVGETRIGAGTKIDNLVQVAHGVTIGRNVLLAAQVGIAGSTDRSKTPSRWPGRSVCRVTSRSGRARSPPAQSGIPNSVDPGSFISGYPRDQQPRLVEVVSRIPEAARAQEEPRRPGARLAALEARLK
jgi:UDP-3-O-[3-hydroxymyristoyl] glucosamine N-acyltransferase